MHTFISSISDNEKCAKCRRTIISHGNNATCESCSNVGPCEIIESDDILCCITCLERDKQIKLEITLRKIAAMKGKSVTIEPVTGIAVVDVTDVNDSLNKIPQNESESIKASELLARSIEIDNKLMTSQDFFNAETVSICDVERAINNDVTIPDDQKHYELVKRIRDRFTHFRSILFEAKKLELEIVSRERSLQYRLNDLASKFRLEERERLKLQDLSYVPKEIPVKVPKVKLSPEDKMIESYASLMKVSVEQARIMFANKMKSMDVSNVNKS